MRVTFLLTSSLASCLTMSLLRPFFFSSWLPNVHPHVCSFDCILLTAFLVSFHQCFWKRKQEHNCVQCGHGNFNMPSNFLVFLIKKNNSMLACRIVCCSHQSDCHIWVCILQQSDYHIQVCILQQSDCHIWVCILQQSDCYIRVCILQQSDCHIRVCILQQSDCHIQVCTCILQQSDCHIRVCILQQSDCHIRVCISH